jgi:DNA-binding LytR/AlgR family response regulator
MLAILYQPLPPRQVTLLTVAVIAAVTLYCLAYTALSGVAESPLEGILWATVHVVPFLLAFEALKRAKRLSRQVLVLVTAIGASLALEALIFELAAPWFPFVQRLPSAGLAFLLARTGPLIAARQIRIAAQTNAQAAESGPLPLAPETIDWVAAAGNYVELHTGKRTVLHRAPLASVETLLARQGFVRVHRSRLVARRAIARVRATDLVLHDGVSLKIGARFRADLLKSLGEKLVPSSQDAGESASRIPHMPATRLMSENGHAENGNGNGGGGHSGGDSRGEARDGHGRPAAARRDTA